MCGSTGTEKQRAWCLWELILSTGDHLSRAKSFPRNSRSLRERERGGNPEHAVAVVFTSRVLYVQLCLKFFLRRKPLGEILVQV